jgi:hypothetical protein
LKTEQGKKKKEVTPRPMFLARANHSVAIGKEGWRQQVAHDSRIARA